MAIYQLIRGGGDYTYDEYFGLIPPESKTFEFPLYITVPFESEDGFIIHSKYNDDICKQLYQYCTKDFDDILFELVELENIPDIYINGCKVNSIMVFGNYYGEGYDVEIDLSNIPNGFLLYSCNVWVEGNIDIYLTKE